MKHLNSTLKGYLMGLDANVSEVAITQTSKSLQSLMQVTSNFDSIHDKPLNSIHCISHMQKVERRLGYGDQRTDTQVQGL